MLTFMLVTGMGFAFGSTHKVKADTTTQLKAGTTVNPVLTGLQSITTAEGTFKAKSLVYADEPWTDIESSQNIALDGQTPVYVQIMRYPTESDDYAIVIHSDADIIYGNASCESLFANLLDLQSIDVSWLDTSKVTSMKNMFKNDIAVTSLDLSSWDVRKVKSFYGMFNMLDKAKRVTTNDTKEGRGDNRGCACRCK